MTELDKAYWQTYWADKMRWEDFVTDLQAGVPPRILMAKLSMSRPTFYRWRSKVLAEVNNEM